METMHAAGRRNLPPVPRPSAESTAERTIQLLRADEPEAVTSSAEPSATTDALEDDDTAVFLPTDDVDVDADLPAPEVLAAADEPEVALEDDDPAQEFVSGLRAAAAEFAEAAGALTAVVREAVPPARHRRSRCRVVLRYADGAEADLTFLGAVGRPGTPAWVGFDQQIQQWLGNGQHREPAWLVEDPEASDGLAVDVPAWLAAG
jgi:hypothetical protein